MPRKGQSVDRSWKGGCRTWGGGEDCEWASASHWGGGDLLKLVCNDGRVPLNYLVEITELYA